ncbi:complement factor H-like [Spea bombifrons]|uniref:complement factor H-like n=1 Tax=Spea bombifrons TaxID=233779 RepID=UPI00234BDE6C|nr:complement factor H-like [Spea bombifrons]
MTGLRTILLVTLHLGLAAIQEGNSVKTCKNPVIENGRFRYAFWFPKTVGTDIFFSCNNGYLTPLKEKYGRSNCTENGWTPLPKCISNKEPCGPPPIIDFGDYVGDRKTTYEAGSVVVYKCPNYYVLQGNQHIKCENGTWQDPPICLVPCTVKNIHLKEHNILLRWTNADKLYMEHDDLVSFVCMRGYEISDPTQLNTKCNKGVIMYPKCFKIGSCFLSQSTMKIRNISLDRMDEILPGETVQFECNEGMVPESNLEATCENGNLNYPKCVIAKPCRISIEGLNEKNVELQSMEYLGKTYKHGTEVNIVCKDGFKIRHPSIPLKGTCIDGNMNYHQCFRENILLMNNFDESKLKPVHPNEAYYGDGETVQYVCRQV